jgi:hypothetical protein
MAANIRRQKMSLIGDGIEIMNLIDKAKNADLFKQLGEWIDKVLKLQGQVDELTTERNTLKEYLRFKAALERINGHTFVEGDDEELCPRCAEVDLRPVHLMPFDWVKPPFMKTVCPACQTQMWYPKPFTRAQAKDPSSGSEVIPGDVTG